MTRTEAQPLVIDIRWVERIPSYRLARETLCRFPLTCMYAYVWVWEMVRPTRCTRRHPLAIRVSRCMYHVTVPSEPLDHTIHIYHTYIPYIHPYHTDVDHGTSPSALPKPEPNLFSRDAFYIIFLFLFLLFSFSLLAPFSLSLSLFLSSLSSLLLYSLNSSFHLSLLYISYPISMSLNIHPCC